MLVSPDFFQPKFDYKFSTVSVSAFSDVSLFAEDKYRISAIFCNASGSTNVIIAPEPLTSSSAGIRLKTDGSIFELNFQRYGPLASKEWFAIGSGGTGDIYVIQTIYKPFQGQPRKGD
jgi:hypothetical protein